MFPPLKALWALLLLVSVAHAQFQFFEHMFGGGPQQEGGHSDSQNVPSDSSRYQMQWEAGECSMPFLGCAAMRLLGRVANGQPANCNKYLCPGTLACVHFPHHCPCPHPDVEEKVELGEGSAVCASRGGYKQGETARKIELARKGAL